MASDNLTRWQSAKIIDPGRFGWAVNGCNANRSRYETLGKKLGIPWFFIAVIHCREASFSFGTHLHNGDSLEARTHNVPAGRPKTGTPPFTWEFSAEDALRYDGFVGLKDWGIEAVLERLERYNGLGYRKRGVPSPYLWAGTSAYKSGKYVRDGVYDPTYEDKQPGCAGILKLLGVA